MASRISIVCQNAGEDRIIPRMARALRDAHGWMLGATPSPNAEAVYLSSYFEWKRVQPKAKVPTAAYLTHREEQPPNNAKAKLFDAVAGSVDLRVATCKLYADYLSEFGPTIQAAAPLERDRFVIGRHARHRRPVVGLSGYTYVNHRKGEDLVKDLLASPLGQKVDWQASGHGWPVETKRYAWVDMPKFYQGLDVMVVPSRVEGIPMPTLEALACGVKVVLPRGVGLHNELPDVAGIYRYERGDIDGLLEALGRAVEEKVDAKALREATAPYSVANWCRDIKAGMEGLLNPKESRQPNANMAPMTIAAQDDRIMAKIRAAYPHVDVVLKWTQKHIPWIKRQIAPYQAAVLAYYASQCKGGRILEIGTALGYSACVMATAAPKAMVTTLNPKDGEFDKARANLRIRSNVKILKMTSQEFWAKADGETHGLIFVDGDHSYNMVLHDSQFFNRLAPGGAILFHDYSPTGSDRPSNGSYEALNHLQAKHRAADIRVIGSGNVGMLGWIRQEGETWE